MHKFPLLLIIFSCLARHVSCQDLSVPLKAQILATIMQGKVNKTAKWEKPEPPDQPGFLGFTIAYPRNILNDRQEIAYHLDMGWKFFLSFFNAGELQGLRSYRVFMATVTSEGDNAFELPLEANFHDLEESEYMRLDCLTRAIPYLAWSNYLSITHKDREKGVVLTLKDTERMTPGNACEDYCNVIAFAVYYYAFRQHLTKPLRIVYRTGDKSTVFDYPPGNDFRKVLTLFAQK
jgi:hypothetical protein